LAKRANRLAKPSTGLASRYAGLGLGATLKSKPKPEKARLRGRKPVLQAENDNLPIYVPEPPLADTNRHTTRTNHCVAGEGGHNPELSTMCASKLNCAAQDVRKVTISGMKWDIQSSIP
jgi:hypothetical protein